MRDRPLPPVPSQDDIGKEGMLRRSPFYSNEEAADYLRLSPRTLEKYRVIGGGPPFRKFGRRVFYRIEDLQRWAEQRVCDSTSDPAWKQVPSSG